MNNIDERVMEIVASQKRTDEMTKEVLNQLKDKSDPLDKRWRAFLILSKRIKMPMNTYGDGFVDHLDDNATLYDDFYIERHETVTYADMYERIMESEDERLTKNIDSWCELVLQSGFGGFTHDW